MTQTRAPHEALTDNLKAIFAGFYREVVRFGHHHRAALPLVTILLSYLNRATARFAHAAAKPPASSKPHRDPAPDTTTPGPVPVKPKRPRPAVLNANESQLR